VTERWISIALAATSVGQLLVAELVSPKTGGFGRKFFDNTIARDTNDELGLPTDSNKRNRLTSEVYGTAQLAADGAAVLAAEIAAVAALAVTVFVAVQGRTPWAAWTSGIAALVLILLGIALIVQLLDAKLSRYVVGRPARWKKTKTQETSWWRRHFYNARLTVGKYFQRVRKLHTLTPYKTAIVVAAILSAVIGVLI
jgi:hypothetical protein